MHSFDTRCILVLLIGAILLGNANTQRTSNGRHRTWWSDELEDDQTPHPPPQPKLTINENLVINQNVPLKNEKNYNNNLNSTIVVNLDDSTSINLTPEPLTGDILKVDLAKSGMLLVSSDPTYLFSASNQTTATVNTDPEATKKEKNSNNNKNINFVHQTRRMLNPNSAPKNCLSTLDCDLELNERCLLPENEETLYYDQLVKVQPYTSIYSPYLRKKYKNLKAANGRTTKADQTDQQPICGCASPSFVRNQNSGMCELIRVVELKFRIRTDRQQLMYAGDQNTNSQRTAEKSKLDFARKQSNLHHQLRLEALGQIDYVMKNSDSLQDIVHHFRLTEFTRLLPKNKNALDDGEDEDADKIRRKKKKRDSTRAKLVRRRIQNQYIARGLLLLFSSEYATNFDLLFTNEYCSTQNALRIKANEQMIRQALAATNQTWPRLHFNTVRSVNANDAIVLEHQSDRVKVALNGSSSGGAKQQLELPFIHHRKRKRETREGEAVDERHGLDVQLIEVNSDQINICTLNANYASEQFNEARRKYDMMDGDVENVMSNNSTAQSAELVRKQKQFDYEKRFFRLIYCDDSRAYCNSLPRSRAGYLCVCHSNLMDLSPLMELPGELCGVKCPLDYCGKEGICLVKNSIGYYPNPDHDLAIQQKYLSTAGRIFSFSNGKLNVEKKERKTAKAEEGREDELSELDRVNYRSLIDAHKKNQTLLRQRYYAAIYSVQQRFSRLFENLPSSNLIGSKSSSERKEKDGREKERFQFDFNYSSTQAPQLITFTCTCPGWTMGSRCQFSGWMILLVLGILVILLALITICTVSMLCAPGKSTRRDSTKSSKSMKSNPNTTSLTMSDTSSSSFDIESNSQQPFDSQSGSQKRNQQPHHNQFHNQTSRQRRASEFVNDRRASFANVANKDKLDWNNKLVAKQKAITQSSVQPAFNIIHATPPHQPKEPQKIQFTDTITEIPYDLPYGREVVQISAQVPIQQQMPDSMMPAYANNKRRGTRIPTAISRLAKRGSDEIERRTFELADLNDTDQHVYNTIGDDLNDDEDDDGERGKSMKEGQPVKHVHNVYASAGELRVVESELDGEDVVEESPSMECLQAERRSVGSQTSGFQSGDPSLAYLSAISLRQSLNQLQYDQQQKRLAHRQKQPNQLPTTSISGPIVWF